jgi:ferredoxin
MRITADSTRCVGAGQCVLSAPDVFDQDDDALVVLVDVTPGADDLELVRDAVDRCPSQAITLHES